MADLKKTPLNKQHKKLGAKMIDFGGWEMPVWYSSIIEEHNTVRENCGLFDVSHMGEIDIKGEETKKFVDYILTNKIHEMKEKDAIYTPMLNKDGGIIDDLLAYMINEKKFLLVVNASNVEKDFEWIKSQSRNFDVEVKNVSDEWGQIAIQGPNSEKILQKYVKIDLDKIGFYKFDYETIDGEKVIISRTGYTGEDGFELYMPEKIAEKIWIDLIGLVIKNNGKPCGLGARDTLRFEAKLLLYGNDMDETKTPLNASLKWTVDFDKDFVGKDKLLEQKEKGLNWHLRGLEINNKMPVRHGYKIFNENDEEVGFITSGVKSPTLNKNLALAYLKKGNTKIGTKLFVEARNKKLESIVVKTPFYKGSSNPSK
ncbi:glycine cleavage system aminomethyltransferase GcvT [Geotoga petraea]|jgi:aminomethyltransferase|uniref:Aminomethyltransferase n=1 Tax=Geotoga petraea TaxID=28234 RepID=A0A4Z0W4W9_9BACT|nr:glycine cleavage system aminomethyltransferase GcvT [Geotoga petraea]MDK2945574.1 aminomethyltransferase [Geotoga sp.]TGG88368.1 glycine cleavage system aminomethyltransferase GcvT [Geotoga petraea]